MYWWKGSFSSVEGKQISRTTSVRKWCTSWASQFGKWVDWIQALLGRSFGGRVRNDVQYGWMISLDLPLKGL